jgi:hypothetical protein
MIFFAFFLFFFLDEKGGGSIMKGREKKFTLIGWLNIGRYGIA